MFPRLRLHFGWLFGLDALHHVNLVADPLLGPFIAIMSIGIMGVLHRLGGPCAARLGALDNLELFVKHPAQQFDRFQLA